MESLITPVKKYTKHDIITRGSIDLTGTGDPLKLKEYQVFLSIWLKEWPDSGKKLLFWGVLGGFLV